MRWTYSWGVRPFSGVVVGGHEQFEVCRQLLMIGVVVAISGRVPHGGVYPSNLVVGPWVVWVSKLVLDAVLEAEPVNKCLLNRVVGP
jgi:hypothetical protein